MTPPDSDAREVAERKIYGGHLRHCYENMKAATMDGKPLPICICDVTPSDPQVSLPLPLAQRILAALEDCDVGEVHALAAELRAVIGK